MYLDWSCPNCNEKHISRIKPIDIGDTVSLKCSDCNADISFEVKQRKFYLTCKDNNFQYICQNAVAWE